MGTCASVNASQVHPLPEGPGIILDTAVFTRPSQTGTSSVRTKRLELKDATPHNLKEVFKLDFYPKVVTDKKTQLTRFHKGPPTKPFSKLQVNAEYEVGGGEDEEEGEEEGTSDFNDVMADLKLWPEAAGQSGDNHCSGVIGKYHAGFMDLAFRVPAHRILKKYSKSRIVVCGHSLGGAVAHIVAINMMMHLRSNNQPTDNVKSIAFGTPYFGNDVAQQFVEEYNLSPHLLTIINEKDPVPYILRLAETIQCAGKTVMKKFERSSPGVKVILGLLTEFLIEGAKDALRRLLEELGKCKGMPKDLADLDLDSIYVPIGWYLHISCSTTKAGGGGHWNRSLLDHIGAVQYARPDIRDWKAEDFQCHRMSNYRTTFFQIARGTTYQSDDENSRSSDVTMTDPIFPARIKKLKVHVLTVKDATDDSRSTIAKKCQIEIKGDNLDFLERDVPISGKLQFLVSNFVFKLV
uniref:Fungal lipase-type domain-containing protein n=1 Tax=Branchiostoma floridae TaxID=7739 RepID=C3Y6W8_BRAFL|eukprot:XP_002608068.1 hypothetical protein BRAFLDRAFT_75158 [Branchiostoma floridae]